MHRTECWAHLLKRRSTRRRTTTDNTNHAPHGMLGPPPEEAQHRAQDDDGEHKPCTAQNAGPHLLKRRSTGRRTTTEKTEQDTTVNVSFMNTLMTMSTASPCGGRGGRAR